MPSERQSNSADLHDTDARDRSHDQLPRSGDLAKKLSKTFNFATLANESCMLLSEANK